MCLVQNLQTITIIGASRPERSKSRAGHIREFELSRHTSRRAKAAAKIRSKQKCDCWFECFCGPKWQGRSVEKDSFKKREEVTRKP